MPPAVILTLDAAGEGCAAAVVSGGVVLAEASHEGAHGSAAILPQLVSQVLLAAGTSPTALSAIAVTVGPGSFTGIRAGLALASGIGLSAAVPVIGVLLADALRASLPDPGLPFWVAVDSKRGRIFLDRAGDCASFSLPSLPLPSGPVAVAGNAAPATVQALRARGASATLLRQPDPTPAGIARAAAASPRPAVPVYVDPVEARPGQPPRPAPQ